MERLLFVVVLEMVTDGFGGMKETCFGTAKSYTAGWLLSLPWWFCVSSVFRSDQYGHRHVRLYCVPM